MTKVDETIEELQEDLDKIKDRVTALEVRPLPVAADKAPIWAAGFDHLDAELRKHGLTLSQVVATFVKNVTGHDVKVEQTTDAPAA
jgi:hypothetical protein